MYSKKSNNVFKKNTFLLSKKSLIYLDISEKGVIFAL